MHRKSFSLSEIRQIELLIEKKLVASDSQQKTIRNNIRSIGFYWSDFHSRDVPYTVENFRQLIIDGDIHVIEDEKAANIIREKSNHKPNTLISPNLETKPINKDFKKSLEPWVGNNPQVVILGTMPGDKSLELQSYYSNPNNSFWKLMFVLFGKCDDISKKDFITSQGIALWDCLSSGIRRGSMDSGYDETTLKGNDIQLFLNKYPTIHTIVLNGSTKTLKYFRQYCNVESNIKMIVLPSTASYIPFDEKLKKWSIIKKLINKQ